MLFNVLLLRLTLLVALGEVGRIRGALSHGGNCRTAGRGRGVAAAPACLHRIRADILFQNSRDGAGAEMKLHVETLFRGGILPRIFVQHYYDLSER